MNQVATQPQYEYAEVEFFELSVESRSALIMDFIKHKQRVLEVEDASEPKLRV